MARVHEIAVASETGAFEKGIKSGVVKPLEDAEKALKKLGDTNVGKDIDRDLDAAQKATRNLKDETKDAAEAIEDAFRKSYRRAKNDADDATDRMKHGFREAGDEAQQSAREGAASFTGEFDDVADFIQEVSANAFSGFGPAGAVAGLAAAVGLGFAVAKVEEMTQKVEDLQQEAKDVHFAALEKGVSTEAFVTSVEGATQALEALNDEGQKEFRWWWEEDSTGLQEFNRDLRRVGETQADATQIFRLGSDALDEYSNALDEQADTFRAQARAIKESEKGMGTLTDAQLLQINSLNEQADATDRLVQTIDGELEKRREAAERSSAWTESGAADASARADAEEESAERVKRAIDGVRDSQSAAFDTMRDKAYEKATADDRAFDIGKWLDYVEQSRAQAESYRSNLQTMQLSPEEWSNFLSLPEEARVNIAASFGTVGEEGKARIRTALGDGGGGEAGSKATVAFSESFQPEADVEVTTDTSESEAKVQELIKPRELPVSTRLDSSSVDGWTPPTKTMTTNVLGNTWALERAIDRIDGRTIFVNIEGRNRTGVPFQ